MSNSEAFKIHISGNIVQKDVESLIYLYKNCEISAGDIVDTNTGEILTTIEILITPKEINNEYFAEVDPLFLGYLTLLLNKFEKLEVSIEIENPFIEKLKTKYSDEIYPESLKISDRAFSISDQIGFIKENNNFTKRILFKAYWYHKEKRRAFPVPVKAIQSKRFFPTILITEKNDITIYFNFCKDWNKNVIALNYYNEVKSIVKKLVSIENKEFSMVQIFILRLLLSEDNPSAKKEALNKDFIDYCINYSYQLTIGLKELALNILEHSKDSKDSENGIGVITGRIFEKERLAVLKGELEQPYIEKLQNNSFNLDINIIDLGFQPIREKYIVNIEDNERNDAENLFKIDYKKDITVIKDKDSFLFEDFYLPNTKTDHQLNKLISRYGLQYFTHIITQRFNGFVKAISHNESIIIEGKDENPKSNQQSRYGTSYSCIIPFDSFNEFYRKTKDKEPKSSKTGSDESTLSNIEKYSEMEITEKSDDNQFDILYFSEFPKILSQDKYNYIKTIYLEFLNVNFKYRKNIFLIDAQKVEIDSSSDWTRLLSVLSLEFKNIIVKNISKEVTKEIIDLRRIQSSNPIFNFWSIESNILFYSHQKNPTDNYGRYGATILTGENEAQFNFVNLNVWKNHYSFYQGFIHNQEKIEEIKPIGPLYSNSHLKYFDLVLKNIDEFGCSITLFELSLQYALNKELPKNLISKTNNKGYKINDTHFRLGSKIHISSFYYAKRVFQNSFFTTPLAYILSEYLFNLITITEKNINGKEFTLIGYENYSEFIVSTTRSLLSKRLGNEYVITHSTINNNTNLSRPLESIHKNIFIVVPIASSFSTSVKIKNDLETIFKRNTETEGKTFNFIEPNINLILVGHNNFEKTVDSKLIDGYKEFTSDLLKEYGWNSINPIDKTIKLNVFGTGGTNKSITQKYFIPVYTEWQKANECIWCFPQDIKKERCLIETGSASITPSLIFGLPKTKPNKNPENNLDLLGSLYYGNLEKGNNNYLYFTRVGEIINRKNKEGIQTNKNSIVKWLKGIKKFISDSEDFKNKKVVLVTPSNSSKSNFIDLVNEIVFGYTANCLSISLQEDYIENAESLYADGLYRAGIVIYVDDVLSTVNSFLETNYIVKYIRKKLGSGQGINYCLSLINRMSFDSEENLLLKLTPLDGDISKNLFNAHNRLLYFTKMNNPSINEPNDEFPLHKEQKRYEILSQTSSLDSTRSLFYNKTRKLTKHNLLDKIDIEAKEKIDDEIAFEGKKLFQLLILNEIYSLFEYELPESVTKETDADKRTKAEEDYERLRQEILDKYFNTPIDDPLSTFKVLKKGVFDEFYTKKNDIYEVVSRHKVHADVLLKYRHNLDFVILKIICSTPLVYYKDIRESAFKWVIEMLSYYRNGEDKENELKTIGLNKLTAENLPDYFKVNTNDYYSEFQKLKFLLKRTVQLKSNYIIHVDFFNSIKNLINLLFKEGLKLEKYKNINDADLAHDIEQLFASIYLPGKENLYNYVDALFKVNLISKKLKESLLDKYEINNLQIESSTYVYNSVNLEGKLAFENQDKIAFELNFNKLKSKDKFRLSTSKKLIYEFIVLIQELIYEHEPKAIILEKTINNLIVTQNNNNGNFNHYLRLLKLENTAAIESFWEYFLNKEKSNLVTENIDLGNYEKDPRYESIKELITINEDSKPFINFLKLKVELHNWENNKQIESENYISVIDENIRKIQKHTSAILGDNVEECYFSINYNKKEIPEPTDIFFFDMYNLKEVAKNKIHFQDSNVVKESLSYKMYDGIYENGYDKYALSNFEFIRKDGNIDFRKNTDIDKGFVASSWEFTKDKSDCNILLIRMSDFVNDKLITQAVLTFKISDNKRVDEKRLRLLLLLRNPLNKFTYDSLFNKNVYEYISKKEADLNKYLLNHSMKKYIDNLNIIYNEKNKPEDDVLHNIISDAMRGQLDAYNLDNNKLINKDLRDIESRFKLLLESNKIEGTSINNAVINGLNNSNNIEIDLFVFDIVFLEIIINIKTYSYRMNRGVEINFENQEFTFTNNKENGLETEEKEKGVGFEMCKKLCSDLGVNLKSEFKNNDDDKDISGKHIVKLKLK